MASLAISVGAWVGSAAVGELVTRVASFFGGQYKLQSDVQDKLQRLKELLLEIESVVEAAAGKDIKNRKLMEWFMELKEVAYDADDLLDTFEYRLLEKKVNEDKEVSSFASSSTNAFKRTCTAAAYYTLLSSDEDVNELNTLLERLERMASRVGNFLTLLCLDGQSKKPGGVTGQRLTSSLLTSEHSFVGRVKEKEDIINILRTTERRGARNVHVLPIIGIGGVGKTTLVQVVYNEERVKSHFSLRMWVCVSESFDVTRITREILEQADCKANYYGITNLNALQENLNEKLSSKKFLLVLDDIWNDTEKTSWDTLKAPLCYGKDGSMILLTSRLPKVAKLMGTVNPIELEGLPEDEYWSFFKEQSFGGANPEEHSRLVAIGKKITSKLKGSPLAAKTMGPLLNDNLDVDHWDSISKSEIWELEKDQDGIMAALKLSYLHLPAHLRQCFAYMSIFPKDRQFERDNVVRMWMAQGMIHLDSRTKRTEDVGKDYFNELISKSFFQPVNHYKEKYTIHDLLHDLAESVSKDDCFRIDGNEFRTIPTTIRHLHLNEKHLARLKENTVVLEKLRTLILHGNVFANPDDADLQHLLIQLRKIRLLTLRRLHLRKCPDNLSSLIHLRYLDISCYGSKEVPGELTKLYHLQTLELWKLRSDCVLAGITNLINLRHFNCDKDILSKVPGIGKLTCLQKLSMFCVQRDPEFQIVQLKYLREVCGRLSINNLDCVDSKEEAKEAKLCDKGYLEELCLVWDNKRNMKPDEVEVGILEGLRPNPNLEQLIIDGYRGTLPPSWMVNNHSLTNLVCLRISNCWAWKDLPPLGQLRWLQRLKICGMDAVKEVGTSFHGKDGFPSLESLELIDFPQWEEWSADEKVILFPRLVKFHITRCPRLKAIPPLPTTLKELELEDVGLTIKDYPDRLVGHSFTNLVNLTISKCRTWKELPPLGQLLQLRKMKICGMDAVKQVSTEFHGKDGFPSLNFLLLKDFPQWEEWSTDDKVFLFPRLEWFQIEGCPRLKSIPPLPTTLKDLKVDDVGLTILPKLQMASSCPSNSLSSSCTSSSSSLETLAISRCIDLKSVGEWFMQHHNNLRHLVQVNIRPWDEPWAECRNKHGDERKPLSLNCFSKLIALQTLEIGYCNIFATSDTEEDSGLLPPPLNYLYLENCFVADNIMSKCLQRFSSLESLIIFRIPDIMTISFSEGLQQLTRLRTLNINSCEELLSIAGFQSLRSLDHLIIHCCPKITIINGLEQLAQLKCLNIQSCKELSSIPKLEGLSSLQRFHVCHCPKITIIIGLDQLIELKWIEIRSCKELSSVPGLEALQLIELEVDECPNLNSEEEGIKRIRTRTERRYE